MNVRRLCILSILTEKLCGSYVATSVVISEMVTPPRGDVAAGGTLHFEQLKDRWFEGLHLHDPLCCNDNVPVAMFHCLGRYVFVKRVG